MTHHGNKKELGGHWAVWTMFIVEHIEFKKKKKSKGKLDVKHSSGGGKKSEEQQALFCFQSVTARKLQWENICVACCPELLVAVMNEWDVDE